MMGKRILSILWYVLWSLAYLAAFLQTSMLLPVAGGVLECFLPYLTCSLFVLALVAGVSEYFCSGKETRDRIVFAIKMAGILFCACHWMNRTDVFSLSALLLFTVSSHLVQEKRLLSSALYIGCALVLLLFFLSLLGIVENNRGNSFGFLYRTDYSAHLLSLALMVCVLKEGKLNWTGELLLLALTVFMGVAVGGKADFICMLVLVAGTLLMHYGPSAGEIDSTKWSGYLRYSFIAAAVLSFVITLSYLPLQGLWDKVPGLSSVKSRLYLGTLGLQEYPISLFGHPIPEMGHGWSEGGVAAYFFLDNAYVRLYLLFGVATLAFFVGLMTYVLFRLHKHKRYYSVFALSVLALESLLEFECIHLAYNAFIFLAFCRLSPPQSRDSAKFRLADLPRWKVLTGSFAAVLLCVVFVFWCWSAYRISSWREHVPAYDATLLVPAEEEPSLNAELLQTARGYLQAVEDAACIVGTETDREWLVRKGIDPSRVYVNSHSSIDGMLLGASRTIALENLPPRLTICTFYARQERIDRQAKALHIPLNSLVVKTKPLTYLRIFAQEQWDSLWEED